MTWKCKKENRIEQKRIKQQYFDGKTPAHSTSKEEENKEKEEMIWFEPLIYLRLLAHWPPIAFHLQTCMLNSVNDRTFAWSIYFNDRGTESKQNNQFRRNSEQKKKFIRSKFDAKTSIHTKNFISFYSFNWMFISFHCIWILKYDKCETQNPQNVKHRNEHQKFQLHD